MQLRRNIFILFVLNLPVVFSYAQENKPAGKALSVDSVKNKVANHFKSSISAIGKSIFHGSDSLLPKNYPGEFKNIFLQGKNSGELLFSKIALFGKGKFIELKNTSIESGYTYLRDTSGTALGLMNELEGVFNYNVTTGVTLMSMPFDVSFRGTNSLYTANYTPFDKLAKFNFDHKKYLQEIQSKVISKLNPDKVVAVAASRINTIRNSYERMLQQELQRLKNDFAKEYNSVIELPLGVTDLAATDLSMLRNRIMESAGSGYMNSIERIQEKIKSGNTAPLREDSMYKRDIAVVKRMEVLEKVYQKVVSWKERFENNKAIKELRSNLPFTPGNFKSFLDKPANLQKAADEYLDMNAVQRLFMNITRLDLGQNPVQGGDFSLQNLINAGINTEFANKKATVGFLYGRNHNINNWLQSGLTSTVTNEYSSVAGFKLGSGTSNLLQQFVSINLFDFTNTLQTSGNGIGLQPDFLANPGRRDATISFHTGVSLSAKHTVSVDVSRSFGSYVNNLSRDSIGYKENAHNDLLSDAGKSNYAALVEYTGEILQSDFRLFVKTVGLGYNNPGNILLRAGETQVGLGIARRLAKQKLSARYSVDYRKQIFDPAKRYSHTAINNKLQLSYRVKRNTRIGMSYQRSDFDSKLFTGGSSVGVNERLQADGAYSFRIAGKKVMNNVTISHQRMEVPVFINQDYKSNSVMIMYSSTAIINKNPLSVMLLMNRSDNKDYLFNTSMFTSEVNYSYAISQKIRLGNSLGYYANSGWNRQVGIKQQLSATLLGKLSVDIDVSYRKAVQVIRPELANQLFISSGMHFDF